jgi:hypothetical protein
VLLVKARREGPPETLTVVGLPALSTQALVLGAANRGMAVPRTTVAPVASTHSEAMVRTEAVEGVAVGAVNR